MSSNNDERNCGSPEKCDLPRSEDDSQEPRNMIVTADYSGPDRRDPNAFREDWAPLFKIGGAVVATAVFIIGLQCCAPRDEAPVVPQQTIGQ